MSGGAKVTERGLSYASYMIIVLEDTRYTDPVIETTSATPKMMWLWRGPWLRLV